MSVVSTHPTDRMVDDDHVGYVAGRYRSGVWSDQWTEVGRCAEHTFTAYAPACTCGWRGPVHPPTPHGSWPATARGPSSTAPARNPRPGSAVV